MQRAYFSAVLSDFLKARDEEVLGRIAQRTELEDPKPLLRAMLAYGSAILGVAKENQDWPNDVMMGVHTQNEEGNQIRMNFEL